MSRFSVIIPAHNEEKFLPDCLEALERARERVEGEVETIVVLNRCGDGTEEIAKTFGARLVREDEANLSVIRKRLKRGLVDGA